ncbi:ABC transporter ATP-binding protein [Paenibacillus hodogayensis]|uniref:ABC transporter ATP-binding protein n=1 Tax=Paenibacillus hodogayensis TaxID=279208 RepID=A0ABV5VU39_9BACL
MSIHSEECIIRIDQVSKSFGAFQAVRQVSLDIEKGSFTTLLGPSGCGKTTLMRLIAGFYEPDAGQIFIEGSRVNGKPAFKRNTPLVFQEYALFPHMTVFDNIAYGLKLRKTERTVIRRKVEEMLDMFGLRGMESRLPKELSGGQQQRVAFARALVIGQNILLMDEPLSNLDAKMRVEVRSELRELQQRTGVTAIFVTHDQDEALSLSDRIAVFQQGLVRQIGTPWDIYFKPNSRFVADFVGTANFLHGTVAGLEEGDIIVRCHKQLFRVAGNGGSFRTGDQVTLVIRPECIAVSQPSSDVGISFNAWSGDIVRSSFLGHMIRYGVSADSFEWTVDDSSPSLRGYLQGKVGMSVDKRSIHILPAEAKEAQDEQGDRAIS